jgi:AcrR family transcriptional regulator
METPDRGSQREAIRVGSLRGRAIDAALAMVEARGPEGANLRDLARTLGTGPASLYYHFANKDALMAELAVAGFRQLSAAFEDAFRAPQGRNALHAGGNAYLSFAREHPRLYRLMYAESLLAGHQIVRDAEAAAFRTFAVGIGEAADDTLEDRAMALWAFGRGLAAVTLATGDGVSPAARDLARQMVRGLESLMGRSIRQPAGD